MIQDIVEDIIHKIAFWLHCHVRSVFESVFRSLFGKRLENSLGKLFDRLPEAAPGVAGKTTALILIVLVSLLLSGLVDFNRLQDHPVLALFPAVSGFIIVLISTWLAYRTRDNCEKSWWWVLSTVGIIITPLGVTMYLNEHSLGMAIWFASIPLYVFLCGFVMFKAYQAFEELEHFVGFLWTGFFCAAIFLFSYSYEDSYIDLVYPYKIELTKYFAYGNAARAEARLVMPPRLDNYYDLVTRSDKAIARFKKSHDSVETDEQLKEVLWAGYIRPFHRLGSDVDATLVDYLNKINQSKSGSEEREVMTKVIELWGSKSKLLNDVGFIREPTLRAITEYHRQSALTENDQRQ